LLDSNEVKVAAFRRALREHDEASVEAMIREHRESGGISRHVKLRRFLCECTPADQLEAVLARALHDFGVAAREGLRTCAEIPGARDVARRLEARAIPSFVVSGGEEEEVRDALARGTPRFCDLFTHIFGSPTSKAEHLQRLRANGQLVDPGVYFGDARLDMDLAEAHGLAFVLVAGRSDWAGGRELARARGHRVVEDMREIVDEC
jgi:phosphoglycolate phosphatase-like HAD superfamily hydrolase